MLRGIDKERGLYFLLTPVDPSILRNVNCLLLGAISLPSCILTSQVRMQTFVKCFLFFRTESERCLSFSLGLMERHRTWPQTTVLTSAGQESCGFSRDWQDPVMWGHTELRVVRLLAFSFHGWCLLTHQVPSTVYFNAQQVPQSPFTHAPWKISELSEVSPIWPFSDAAHTGGSVVSSVVGFWSLSQSELWVE